MQGDFSRLANSVTMLAFIVSWANTIFRLFQRLGITGIFLLSAVDSSILILPFGMDFLLVGLIVNSTGEWSILYIVAAAIGSMVGVITDDLLSRKASEKGLERFASREQIKHLKPFVRKRAGWALFIASIVPPPFPFTIVVLIASALQYARRKLFLIVLGGRTLRFTVLAVLALHFGSRLLTYANSRVIEYSVYGIIVISVAGSTIEVIRFIRGSAK
jgi:membrane protein YqaA with SNARE-associated domain